MNNKQKLVLSGLSVAAVVAGVAATGGTSAYFYDLEQQKGNSIAACGFDLTYDITSEQTDDGLDPKLAAGQSATYASVNPTGAIQIAGVQPGDAFKVTTVLANPAATSCPGDLWADIDQHFDQEGTWTEPEQDAGDTDSGVQSDPYNDAARTGELGDYLQVNLKLDGTSVFTGSVHQLSKWFPKRIDASLKGGESHTLVAEITAPENTARGFENQIMTDSYTFELDFALAQEGYMPDSTTDLSIVPAPLQP